MRGRENLIGSGYAICHIKFYRTEYSSVLLLEHAWSLQNTIALSRPVTTSNDSVVSFVDSVESSSVTSDVN